MVRVESNKSKNLLLLRFSAHVGVEDTKRSLEEIKSQITELRSGFTLLTDLSSLESMDAACAPQIETTMDTCRKAGVARVIRVIPDTQKDIGLSIMSLFHYPRKIRIVTCETRAEADKLLSE